MLQLNVRGVGMCIHAALCHNWRNRSLQFVDGCSASMSQVQVFTRATILTVIYPLTPNSSLSHISLQLVALCPSGLLHVHFPPSVCSSSNPLALPPGSGGTVMFMNPFNVPCDYPGNTSHNNT